VLVAIREGRETKQIVSRSKMKDKFRINKKVIITLFLLSIFLIVPGKAEAANKINLQDVTIENYDYPYTGGPIEPEKYVVLKYGNVILKNNQDYTITRIGDKSLYGNANAIFVGTIRITGKGNYEGTIEKDYRILPATEYELKINKTEMSMTLSGGTKKLSIYTTPSVYMNVEDVKRSWESSDPSVVTVDESGTLTPVGLGTATITAHYNGKDVTCKVFLLEYLRGDVNQDGFVNIKDIMEIIYFVTKRKVPTQKNIEIGDMNNDGRLDIRDTTPIIGIILKR